MKRNLPNLTVFLYAGSLLLASCTEVVLDAASGNQQEEFISFDITRTQTRGTELSNDALSQMGVFASENLNDYDAATATNTFMYNQLVQKSEGRWSYTPVKQWPSIEGLSFFAYAPYLENAEVLSFLPKETPGLPEFTYRVPQNISEQIDLLIAEPLFDQYYFKTPTVDFSFSHTLSCLDFSAQLDAGLPTGVTMQITEITVSGLCSEGVLPVRYDGAVNWNLNAEKTATYQLTVANGALAGLNLQKTKQQISSKTNKFMPLPQTIGEDVVLSVRGRYTTATGSDETVYTIPVNRYFSQFIPGRKYNINLIMSLTGIIVDFEIVPWDTYEMNIPSFD